MGLTLLRGGYDLVWCEANAHVGDLHSTVACTGGDLFGAI